MSLDQKFESIAKSVKAISSQISGEDGVELYGLYKQAISGDNPGPKPSSDDPKENGKWNGWESKRGLSSEAAKEAYVALGEKVIANAK